MDSTEQARKNKIIEKIKKMCIMDDIFMRPIFHDCIPAVQCVLRIIMEKDDLIVVSVRTQEDLKSITGARSVILDIYATDSEGKKYNIEIQKSEDGAHPKRARYNSSAMDIDNLKVRQSFEELPETYVIIITEGDYFGAGDAIYQFDRRTYKGRLLGDESHIIYVNGAYRGNDPLGRLMHDFHCKTPSEMLYNELAERARYFKESREGVESMCKISEELKAEGRAECMAEMLSVLGISKEEYECKLAEKLKAEGSIEMSTDSLKGERCYV